ncbi:MAG: tol-pal system protein YbgF [Synechococcaceae cyanobacterium SM1_2_3]|nr:tol-pal system protein YbgF [Synechococcaceae cyanobacterium SM1_2_3]
MTRYGAGWLLLTLCAGLLPSAGHAQTPSEQTLTLELLQRIERLEIEVRYLRGELEIQRHQFERLQQKQASAANPVSPQSAVAPIPSASAIASAPTSTTAPSAPPAGTEQADFDAAMNEWREGRYPQAITAWQRFLNVYPNGKLAGEAQYWLGEAYYVSRDYPSAKDAFITLGLNAPQNSRLPDALLKLGYIYEHLGDASRAKEVLQKLVQVYPHTPAATLAEQQLQSLR